jgi:plastocyanin
VSLRPVSLALLTASLAGACATSVEISSGEGEASHRVHPDADVVIDAFTFVPAALEASVGQTVTWVNHDDILHTVTSSSPGKRKAVAAKPGGGFDHDLEPDETFSFTFERAGSFAYRCDVHPRMRGRIVVR